MIEDEQQTIDEVVYVGLVEMRVPTVRHVQCSAAERSLDMSAWETHAREVWPVPR